MATNLDNSLLLRNQEEEFERASELQKRKMLAEQEEGLEVNSFVNTASAPANTIVSISN